MRIASLVVAVVTLACAGVAYGQDAAAEARQHYKKATGHFAIGEFAQAATEYEAAFKLHQDPALLFNAAQSRRLAGENQKALVLYKNFLQLYPTSKNVPAVREQIDKLQEAIAAEEKAKTSPPTGTVEPRGVAEPTPTTPPPATQPGEQPGQPLATTAQPSEGPRPFYKKWWFWTAVGGAVVLAVVIPVAVVTTQPEWNNLPPQGPGASALRVQPDAPVNLAVRW